MDIKDFRRRTKDRQDAKLIKFYHSEIKTDDADDSRAININNTDNIAKLSKYYCYIIE